MYSLGNYYRNHFPARLCGFITQVSTPRHTLVLSSFQLEKSSDSCLICRFPHLSLHLIVWPIQFPRKNLASHSNHEAPLILRCILILKMLRYGKCHLRIDEIWYLWFTIEFLRAKLSYSLQTLCLIKHPWRASLVAQWLRICLLMQGTRVRALVWEDPTCHGAAGPVSHKYWACASGACAPQQERPR